jgi:hypothetical protein
MSLRLPTIVLALSTLITACVTEKGEEEDPFVDGKADAVSGPTLHGALLFDARNDATITETARVHVWTFEITDETQVISLRTYIESQNVDTNLDTVMYLYRRDLGSTGSFGTYYLKNDDHDGHDDSQIDYDGEPGEYRVLIKAFRASQVGAFQVQGQCIGFGCPRPPR